MTVKDVKPKMLQGRNKILWLVPVFLAVAALVGYTVVGGLGPSVVNIPGISQQTSSNTPSPSTTEKVKSITIRLTNDGLDGTANFKLYLKQNDQVKITLTYEDRYGDFHPMYISEYGIQFSTLSPQNTQSTVEFTASDTGTFGLFCQNSECITHEKLVKGQIIVAP